MIRLKEEDAGYHFTASIDSASCPLYPMRWFRMKTPSAHAYVRALMIWGQWLRHWRLTRDPRALRTTLACKLIAAEKFAIWQAEVGVSRSVWAARAERAAREELSIHRVLRQIRRDERVLRATQFDFALGKMVSAIIQSAADEPDEGLMAEEEQLVVVSND
jgi:hypothetical protein